MRQSNKQSTSFKLSRIGDKSDANFNLAYSFCGFSVPVLQAIGTKLGSDDHGACNRRCALIL